MVVLSPKSVAAFRSQIEIDLIIGLPDLLALVGVLLIRLVHLFPSPSRARIGLNISEVV